MSRPFRKWGTFWDIKCIRMHIQDSLYKRWKSELVYNQFVIDNSVVHHYSSYGVVTAYISYPIEEEVING